MFKIAGLSIAFNPTKEEVSDYAHVTVFSESLKAILPIIVRALKGVV